MNDEVSILRLRDAWRESERNAALINLAQKAAADMHALLAKIEAKFKTDHSGVELGKPLPDAPPLRGR